MHNITYPQRNVKEAVTSDTSVQAGVCICRPMNTTRKHSVVEDKPGIKFTVCLSSHSFLKRGLSWFSRQSCNQTCCHTGHKPTSHRCSPELSSLRSFWQCNKSVPSLLRQQHCHLAVLGRFLSGGGISLLDINGKDIIATTSLWQLAAYHLKCWSSGHSSSTTLFQN